MLQRIAQFPVLAVCMSASMAMAAADRLIADFEGKTYAPWTVTGTCFGPGPAHGTLTRQNPVSGFQGKGLVNTFFQGDRTQGTLTSPEVTVDRDFVNMLVGGGEHENQTCMNLLKGDKILRQAMGRNSERLVWQTWDVRRLKGERVRFQIIDRARGGWGHINIDHITLSDTAKAQPRGDPVMEAELVEAKRQEVLPRLTALGVSDIVFAVRMVDRDGHWYANFGTWSNNPGRRLYHDGGKLCRLNVATGKVTVLLDDPKGGVRDPQLHYDGGKILFSYRKGEQPYYHLYEVNIDGSGLRQITDGPHDDIEPTYMPDGSIIFGSSRCNRMVNCYYVRVAILYRCDSDGKNTRPLSSNIEHDNTPWPLPDGRVLHQRWEYIDRSQVLYHHLWTMDPDGTNQMVYYGNQHPSTVMLDAKPIPGTQRVVAAFSPGHGQNEHAGYITVVSPNLGPDHKASAKRISRHLHRDPYPLSADLFLIANECRIELLTADGERIPLYSMPAEWRRHDGRMKVHEPRPLRPRKREHVIPPRIVPNVSTGTVAVQNVYHGRKMDGVAAGDIKKLLILEALPKPVNFSGGWEPLTYGGSFTLERVLGTVPVAEDGSAYFAVPALRSLFLVALDAENRSVKRMQSFFTVQPGEVFSCVGCHEHRVNTPTHAGISAGTPQALATRAAERIQPYEGVPAIYDFPRDIQPILDRHCVACHGYDATQRGGARAGGVILTGDRGGMYSHSYFMLTIKNQISDGRNAHGNRPPRSIGSSASPFLEQLTPKHFGVSTNERERLVARLWIESAAPYPGTYAALGSGMVGRGRRTEGWGKETDAAMARRCASCHKDEKRLPTSPGDDVLEVGFGGRRINAKDPRYRFSNHILFNLSRPQKSLLLLAPLARDAGGYAGKPGHPVVFKNTADPDYSMLLGAVRATKAQLDRVKRFDMPGFRPNKHYVREMILYGILPCNPAPDLHIDPYATDEAYWRSLHYAPPTK